LIAVLSDIHANARALRAAFSAVESRDVGQVIILGDLFTYGCDPIEVCDLIDSRPALTLVAGNHDLLYGAGNDLQYRTMPAYIRESVDWTREQLGSRRIETPMAECVFADDMLFAHANPFPFGDWTYMTTDESLIRAAEALSDLGVGIGVFGHTHRRRLAIIEDGRARTLTGKRVTLDVDARRPAVIANSGSVGQPRGEGSFILFLHRAASSLELEWMEVLYDQAAHVDSILKSTMTAATREALAGFFTAGSPA